MTLKLSKGHWFSHPLCHVWYDEHFELLKASINVNSIRLNDT